MSTFVACGGSTALSTNGLPDGPDAAFASTLGQVDGVDFAAQDVAAHSTGATVAPAYPALEISLLDGPGACLDSAQLTAPLGERVLRIYVFNAKDQTAVGPGTYATWQSADGGGSAVGTVFAGFFWHDFHQTCAFVPVGIEGTVTLTRVSAGWVSGSFDATLDQGRGHLSGTFVAPSCTSAPPATTALCM